MTDKVGRYPFRTYGSLSSDATFPFALEDQTISLYPSFLFLPAENTPFGDPRLYEPIMVHELAHQWYGDDVLPALWSDLWLNEGHATWYEWEYAQERGDPDFYLEGAPSRTRCTPPTPGATSCAPRSGPSPPRSTAPTTSRRCSAPTSTRAARSSSTPCARWWVTRRSRRSSASGPQRYGGGSASTADFIAFASRIAHRDLTAFLTDWLYGDHDAAHARPPRLDRRPGRPAGDQGRPPRTHSCPQRAPTRLPALDSPAVDHEGGIPPPGRARPAESLAMPGVPHAPRLEPRGVRRMTMPAAEVLQRWGSVKAGCCQRDLDDQVQGHRPTR